MPCLLSIGRLFSHNNHPTAAEARLFHYISKGFGGAILHGLD